MDCFILLIFDIYCNNFCPAEDYLKCFGTKLDRYNLSITEKFHELVLKRSSKFAIYCYNMLWIAFSCLVLLYIAKTLVQLKTNTSILAQSLTSMAKV